MEEQPYNPPTIEPTAPSLPEEQTPSSRIRNLLNVYKMPIAYTFTGIFLGTAGYVLYKKCKNSH
jgi:hypothetical protein